MTISTPSWQDLLNSTSLVLWLGPSALAHAVTCGILPASRAAGGSCFPATHRGYMGPAGVRGMRELRRDRDDDLCKRTAWGAERHLTPRICLLFFSSSCICFSQIPKQLLGIFRLLSYPLKRKTVLASCCGSALCCVGPSVEASRCAKAKNRRHHQEPQLPLPLLFSVTGCR